VTASYGEELLLSRCPCSYKINMKKQSLKLIWNPIHPHRDWRRVIIIFSFLAFAVVVWSTYLFFSYQTNSAIEELPIAADNGTTQQVRQIREFFDERGYATMPEADLPL